MHDERLGPGSVNPYFEEGYGDSDVWFYSAGETATAWVGYTRIKDKDLDLDMELGHQTQKWRH